ncbi:unnamed protein product, partial [Dibothriocephalus latus]
MSDPWCLICNWSTRAGEKHISVIESIIAGYGQSGVSDYVPALQIPEASCSRHIRTAIPDPVFTLFAFLARQGVHVTDLFRRPGNITQMKTISSQLAVGEPVDWSSYNVYTVANVAKRFLLSVPGGLLGDHNERRLLATAVSYCPSEDKQQQKKETAAEKEPQPPSPPKQDHLRPHHHHQHHPRHHQKTPACVGGEGP